MRTSAFAQQNHSFGRPAVDTVNSVTSMNTSTSNAYSFSYRQDIQEQLYARGHRFDLSQPPQSSSQYAPSNTMDEPIKHASFDTFTAPHEPIARPVAPFQGGQGLSQGGHRCIDARDDNEMGRLLRMAVAKPKSEYIEDDSREGI